MSELQRTLTHLIRACDVVFGSSSIVLAAIATWCTVIGDAHLGLVLGLWAVPVFNLTYSLFTRHADRVRADLVRGIACVPLASYLYVAEPVGVLRHLWLPALMLSVAVCMTVGIGTRRASAGIWIALLYAAGVFGASLLSTDGIDAMSVRDACGLLLVDTILSFVAARLGRTLRSFELELEKRVSVEAELHQAQKLESVGRLAAGIAHEINTPVQFVGDSLTFVRTAVADLFALVPDGPDADAADLPYLRDEVPKSLALAEDGLQRVSTIVRSMRLFARADETAMQPTDLNRAIESTLVVARNEYKYVADLVTELAVLPQVRCHAGEINQVVLNIVVNAAHAIAASGKRGTLHVSTRCDDSDVVIAIRDTGPGIPERVRGRIFEPFFTTKPVGHGTGQGLAIARHVIVDKHHGKLTFDTEVGLGTTFFVRLPIAGTAAA